MHIISRTIVTPMSKEAVLSILKSSASRRRPFKRTDDHFYFKVTNNRYGKAGFIPVSGQIGTAAGATAVRIEVHPNLSFYIGVFLLFLGFVHLLYNLVIVRNGNYSGISCLIFSVIIYIWTLSDSIDCLDNFERKLLKTGDGSVVPMDID